MAEVNMRNAIIILTFSLLSCSDKVNEEKLMSSTIDEVYTSDQEDRKTNNINWSVISKRDELRSKRVNQLLDSNKIKTAKEYSQAAMIFQHGEDSTDYKKAILLMKKAIEMDSTISKWLFAAATDRYLLSLGKAQIYGTQFIQEGNGPWVLKDYDTTAVDDNERMIYGVGTLEEQKNRVAEMNSEHQE